MNTAEQLTPELEVDINRSRLYQLLALGFSFPGRLLLAATPELYALGTTLYPDLGLKDLVQPDLPALENDYINRFDGVDQKAYCKPYEALWLDGDRAQQQWEVKKFYHFFGLAMNGEGQEMPDHLALELEFMHVLVYRSVVAARQDASVVKDANGPSQYLHAQRDFLERHLGRWLPAFCDGLQTGEAHPFYRALARLAGRFVSDDLEWIRSRQEAGG
ncbi:molecular chaperone TorD family protein [Thiohalobacter sp. IOR34]|uniref:TorD/DmsD family molecular chaperone n=1 Tax=Thiohalobacter sp. IOR34 TaxID=3057176 RepID=UPI0025AFA4AE|nr:molecular chaperone TorD family protein [Thiohalobacter sp. IOR34]WJW74907.1 molecular chaperone TorD family protein [Thiohalobacter sp. IOR34]